MRPALLQRSIRCTQHRSLPLWRNATVAALRSSRRAAIQPSSTRLFSLSSSLAAAADNVTDTVDELPSPPSPSMLSASVAGKYQFRDFDPPRAELFIETEAQLKSLIELLEPHSVLGIDTEFITALVYRPTLHVLQISSPTVIAAIDYQAVKTSIKPLLQLLLSREVLILHSCQSDLQILHDLTACHSLPMPTNIFDTQIAAAFVGYGDMIGYAKLLLEMFGIEISKRDTMSDWSKRPLALEQIAYAMNDVRHLHQVYHHLLSDLTEKGRLAWCQEEMRLLSNPLLFRPTHPSEAWRMIWMGKKLADHSIELSVLQSVAKWRELEARKKDTMPNILLRHEAVYAIAIQMPSTPAQLKTIQGIKPWVINKFGRAILAAVEEGKTAQHKLRHRVPHKQAGRLKEGLMNLLSSRAQSVANQHGISVYQVAPKQELFDLSSMSMTSIERAMTMDENEFQPNKMICNFFGVKYDLLPYELSTAPKALFDDSVPVDSNTDSDSVSNPLHRPLTIEQELETLTKLKVLSGWRRKMIGEDLLSIIKGTSLAWDNMQSNATFMLDAIHAGMQRNADSDSDSGSDSQRKQRLQQFESSGMSAEESLSAWVHSLSVKDQLAVTRAIQFIAQQMHLRHGHSVGDSGEVDPAMMSELRSVLGQVVAAQSRPHSDAQSASLASSSPAASA